MLLTDMAEDLGWIGTGVLTYAALDDNRMTEGRLVDIVLSQILLSILSKWEGIYPRGPWSGVEDATLILVLNRMS